MERSGRNVDAFLAALPDEARDDLTSLDRVISDVMSGHDRALYVGKMWGGTDQEIIGYGTVRYRRSDNQNVEWFLVGLAQQQQYISLYINAVEDRQYLPEKYGKELGKVKIGKAALSFSGIDDIDLEQLAALVERARDLSDDAA